MGRDTLASRKYVPFTAADLTAELGTAWRLRSALDATLPHISSTRDPTTARLDSGNCLTATVAKPSEALRKRVPGSQSQRETSLSDRMVNAGAGHLSGESLAVPEPFE